MGMRELVGDAKGVPASEKVENHWHRLRNELAKLQSRLVSALHSSKAQSSKALWRNAAGVTSHENMS